MPNTHNEDSHLFILYTHRLSTHSNGMQLFAAPRLTLELPPSISYGLWHYLVTATIPPPISPLCGCVSILQSALTSFTASLWCILILPAAYPNTSPNFGCILGIPVLALLCPLLNFSAPANRFTSFCISFSQIQVCQIMIPTPLNPLNM